MPTDPRTYTDDFIHLISANERLIYKVCRVYENDADTRQDLFQEIVLQAWSAYPRYRQDAAFSTCMKHMNLSILMLTFLALSCKDTNQGLYDNAICWENGLHNDQAQSENCRRH